MTSKEAIQRIKDDFEIKYDNLKNEKDRQNIIGLCEVIEKDLKTLKEENKLLKENNENLDETYFETWSACERLKENSNYALMFIDDIYCLVDTKDNKFEVIDNYETNNKGIIDNGIKKKLKALEIIRDKKVDVPYIMENPEAENVFWYNSSFTGVLCEGWRMLSQEEYDLVKEVLTNE